MSDETPSDNTLSRFEAQLSALSPQSRIDRDQLLFAAGQRSAQRGQRVANRLLLVGNLGLTTVLALVIAGSWRGQPLSSPISPTDNEARVVTREMRNRSIEGTSLASAEPYANYRFLRSLSHDEWPQSTAADAREPRDSSDPKTETPLRLHLNRLLRESAETL